MLGALPRLFCIEFVMLECIYIEATVTAAAQRRVANHAAIMKKKRETDKHICNIKYIADNKN